MKKTYSGAKVLLFSHMCNTCRHFADEIVPDCLRLFNKVRASARYWVHSKAKESIMLPFPAGSHKNNAPVLCFAGLARYPINCHCRQFADIAEKRVNFAQFRV